MSSDSEDSDICDLTTNAGSFMQRAKAKLAKQMLNVKPSQNNNSLNDSLDDEDLTMDTTSADATLDATSADDTLDTTSADVTSVDDLGIGSDENSQSTSAVNVITAESSSSVGIAVGRVSTATFKEKFDDLNKQCEELKSGLSTRRGRKGKGRGRGRGRGCWVWAPRRSRRNRSAVTISQMIAAAQRASHNFSQQSVSEISTDEEEVNEQTITVKKAAEIANMNPVVEVHILWKSVDHKLFKVRKNDKLDHIIKYLTDKFELNPLLLMFTLDDKRIDLATNTYATLRLTENSIIEGSVLPETYLGTIASNSKTNIEKPTGLKVKIQFARNKQFDVFVQPEDTLEILYSFVVKELDLELDKFKIVFDGQRVWPSETLKSLDVEGGDTFDVIVT